MTVTNILNTWRWNIERGKKLFNHEKEKVDTSTDAFIGDENHSSKTWLKSEWNNYPSTFCIKMRQFSVTSAFAVTLNQEQTLYMLGFIWRYFFFNRHIYVAIWHACNSNNQNHVFLWNVIKAYNQQLAFYQWSYK